MSTEQQRQAWRALDAARTPGEWSPSWNWGGTDETRHAVSEGPVHEGSELSDCAPQAEADAAFIAAASTAVAALLADVERLTAQRDALAAELATAKTRLAEIYGLQELA